MEKVMGKIGSRVGSKRKAHSEGVFGTSGGVMRNFVTKQI